MRKFLAVIFIMAIILPALGTAGLASAAPYFLETGFANTWNRVDKAVQDLPGAGRGYTWGPPVAGSESVTTESYNGGQRKVQYFDKARMEINNPGGNPNDLFYITTGLLVKELVTGQRQDGDNSFTPFPPSQMPVAGDPNDKGANLLAPTYASFKDVVTFTGNQNGRARLTGATIVSRINKAGVVTTFTPPEDRRLTGYDTATSHNIADVFVTFGNQQGLIWNGRGYNAGSIFFGNPTYVLGRPVTDPYWTRAVVAGIEKDVLVQLFERRVLTYTPSNPAGFKVEMGNVGQHYYRWRYLENSNSTPSVPNSNTNPGSGSTPQGLNVGINALLNLYNLPQVGAYTQTYEVSSHDPAGGNLDSGHYLYQESDHYVIFDDMGAGAVYRIWMTGTPLTKVGRIQFYLDNESAPRVDMPVADFFSGATAPFFAPLVGNEDVSSGGFFSYVPVPYAHRLKIATTGKPIYYQISYQRLAGQPNITSFTGKEDYSALINMFSNPGVDPKPENPGRQIYRGDGFLPPGKQLDLGGLIKGPGVISAIKLKLDTHDYSLLSQTRIRINWDGRDFAQVDAPLDYFFGSGLGEKRVAGLMAGIDPDTHQYYFYFPMPFRVDARISLFNASGGIVATAHWEIAVDPDPDGKLINANTGYFNATFNRLKEPPIGQDYKVLVARGRGRYVGTVLNMYSLLSAMEGDHVVYLDGSSTPQQPGTGFEDYFNAAFGFSHGPFSQPLHGSAAKNLPDSENNYVTFTGYRFLLGDAVTFNSGMTLGFEHGYIGHNTYERNEVYTSLALWYGLDDSPLQLTDSLQLTDPGSERDHGYSNSGSVDQFTLTSSYEGEKDALLFTAGGYRVSGTSKFTMNINPDNAGVILRRRFDYNDINQQADIFVDGQPVGRWFSPGQNQSKRWRDEDFALPASFTRGKSNITITVKVVNEPAPWSESYYQVFSLKPGSGYIP